MNSKKSRRGGLAGLVLGVMSVLSPNFAHAQDIENVKIESESTSLEIIATFEYKSNRPEPEYNGKTFTYNLWNDGTVSQANPKVEPEPKFTSRWFWDIDGDGKFGQAEIDAIKRGKLIYMHPKFNEIANEEIRKAFGSMDYSPQKPSGEDIEIAKEKVKARENKRNLAYILTVRGGPGGGITKDSDGNIIPSYGLWGGSFGARGKHLGVLLNLNYGYNEEIAQVTTEPSVTGRYFEGRIDNKNFFGTGFSLEGHFDPFFFGAGPNFWSYTTETQEAIKKDGQTILSNTDSKSKVNLSGNFYVGIEGGFGSENAKLGAGGALGYDTRKGFYLDMRLFFPRTKYNRDADRRKTKN